MFSKICFCSINDFFSKVEKQEICHLCSKRLPAEDIRRKAASQVKTPLNYIMTNDKIICPTCVGEYLQHQRILQREKKLLSMYLQKCKLYKYTWNGKRLSLNTELFLDNYLHLSQYKDDCIYKEMCNTISYEMIQVKHYCGNYKNDATEISGVSFPHHVKIPSLNPDLE